MIGLKASSALRSDRWVRPFFVRYKKPLFGAIVLSVLAYAFAAGLMFTSGYLISGAATLPASILLMHLALIAVRVFGLGKPVLQYVERLTAHDWILRVTSSLRLRLYQSLEGQAGLGRAVRRTGDVLGLLSEDLGHLQNMYLRCLLPTVSAWVLWIAATIILGVFSLPIAAGMFVLLGIQLIALPLIAVTADGARRMRMKAMKNEMYAELADDVLGVADWMFSGRSEDYLARHVRSHDRLRALQRQELRSTHRRDFTSQVAFGLAAASLLLWAGAQFGGSPAQDIGSAANYIAAFTLCFFPLIEAFAPVPAAALDAVSHVDSIERLNDLPDPQGDWDAVDGRAGRKEGRREKIARLANQGGAEGDGPRSEEGLVEKSAASFDVVLEDVAFAYPESPTPVLQGFDLRIPHGQTVAILGRSGAGKSTIAALVRGDLAPRSGRVSIGGRNACELGDSAARLIGVIQQNDYLFSDTLMSNLRVGNPGATEADAWRVLEQVGLKEMVERLPGGLYAKVDEAGKRFSGGERHRIALARVLLQNVPIVILDEPTVGLDPVTERALLDTLLSALEGRTVIMITHHLQGVSSMDRVVFLEEGRIALDGEPSALAHESERYRTLLDFDAGLC